MSDLIESMPPFVQTTLTGHVFDGKKAGKDVVELYTYWQTFDPFLIDPVARLSHSFDQGLSGQNANRLLTPMMREMLHARKLVETVEKVQHEAITQKGWLAINMFKADLYGSLESPDFDMEVREPLVGIPIIEILRSRI